MTFAMDSQGLSERTGQSKRRKSTSDFRAIVKSGPRADAQAVTGRCHLRRGPSFQRVACRDFLRSVPHLELTIEVGLRVASGPCRPMPVGVRLFASPRKCFAISRSIFDRPTCGVMGLFLASRCVLEALKCLMPMPLRPLI